MRTFLILTTFLVTAVCSADSLTIGHMTFDFDAPSSLSAAQQAFFQKFKAAVNRHDAAGLLALQDESKKRCTASGEELILKDLDKTIPDNAKVRDRKSVV